jgi:hypothetical protein
VLTPTHADTEPLTVIWETPDAHGLQRAELTFCSWDECAHGWRELWLYIRHCLFA